MHTKTPLTIQETPNDLDFYCDINDGNGEPILSVYNHPESDKRAEFIVKAVNNHDRLVECLKQFVDNGVAVGRDNFHSELLLHNTAQQLLTEINKESNAND